MSEGVVDLLETIEVDEEERQISGIGPRIGVVREEGLEHVEEIAAVAEAGELVGLSLSMAFFGQDS